MKTLTLSLLAALGLSVACVGDPQPAERPSAESPDVVLTPDENGLLHADLMLEAVNDLQTVGLAVQIENAEVVSWTRDDTLLTSGGGQVLPLESRIVDQTSGASVTTFRMVVGTTSPVTSAAKSRLASFVLRPTGGDVRVEIVSTGKNLGLLNSGGARLDTAAHIANGEEG